MPNLIKAEFSGGVQHITLNRPEKHNALNSALIAQLTQAFKNIPENARLVILKGEGPSFCAGADIQYMREQAHYTSAENLADAQKLSGLFAGIRQCDVPVLGVAHGNVFGGGVGLAACCDILICDKNTRFCFSEAKIGLAPALISPYILSRIGQSHTRRYFLTAEIFSGEMANSMGLANFSGEPEQVAAQVQSISEHILSTAPNASISIKKLLNDSQEKPVPEKDLCYLIATLRTSAEGQEGLSAFLEKRKPKWVQ